MAEFAIQVSELSRTFGSVHALRSVSLDVPRGSVFGFLGPNGAGKTTLIRTLLGLLEPTRGQARVFGLDPMRDGGTVRTRCGALLEHHGLYERLSAWHNLDFVARIWRLGRRQRHDRIEEMLTRFGLWERRDDVVGTWSRGMKQKLAIARAMLHRPELVFLDEPTAGLDPVASASLREDLDTLAQQEGVTIFLTTHNLSEAERLCDLVGVIRRGQLVALGPPSALGSTARTVTLEITATELTPAILDVVRMLPQVIHVERVERGLSVTLAAEAHAAPVISSLVAHGVQVEEARRTRPTLEDAFLDLVEAG